EDPVHTPEARAAAVLEHRLGVQVPAPDRRRRAHHLVQEGFGGRIALERRVLPALLVVEDEAQGQPCPARPLRLGRGGAVPARAARAHGRRATASISTSTPGARPVWTLDRAGYGSSKNSR